MPVPYLPGDIVGLPVRSQQQDRIALLKSQAVCLDGFVRRCDYAQIRLIQLQPVRSDGQRALGLHRADRHAHGAAVIVFLYTFCKLRNNFIIRKHVVISPLRSRRVCVDDLAVGSDMIHSRHAAFAAFLRRLIFGGFLLLFTAAFLDL